MAEARDYVAEHHSRMKIRAAAFAAKRRLPPAIGEIVSRELLDWEDFGYRMGGHSRIFQAVDELMNGGENDLLTLTVKPDQGSSGRPAANAVQGAEG